MSSIPTTIQTWLKSLDQDTILIAQIKPSDWERLYKELEKLAAPIKEINPLLPETTVSDCCNCPNILARHGKLGLYFVCEQCNQACKLVTNKENKI